MINVLNKMFSFFKNEKEFMEVDIPRIPHSLAHVLAHAGTGKLIQGVEPNRLALVTIRKKDNFFLLGIQFERDAAGEIFTERHDSLVETVEQAEGFFARFGLGEISWIGTGAVA